MEEENILESLVNYLKPKAHDAMDAIIDKYEQIQSMPSPDLKSPVSSEDMLGMISGTVGGGANMGKGVKNILQKIRATNAKTRRNLKPGAPTQGWQSLDQSNLPRGVLPGKPPASVQSGDDKGPMLPLIISLLLGGGAPVAKIAGQDWKEQGTSPAGIGSRPKQR